MPNFVSVAVPSILGTGDIHAGIADETKRRLLGEGGLSKYPWLEPVAKGDMYLSRGIDRAVGESGLVLGSGDNSVRWNEQGWTTIDIDPNAKATWRMDVNQLRKYIAPNSQDAIVTECLTFGNSPDEGVVVPTLVTNAFGMLKPSGVFIIQTANLPDDPRDRISIPRKREFIAGLVRTGFHVIAKPGVYEEFDAFGNPATYREQPITYYAQKPKLPNN